MKYFPNTVLKAYFANGVVACTPEFKRREIAEKKVTQRNRREFGSKAPLRFLGVYSSVCSALKKTFYVANLYCLMIIVQNQT